MKAPDVKKIQKKLYRGSVHTLHFCFFINTYLLYKQKVSGRTGRNQLRINNILTHASPDATHRLAVCNESDYLIN